MKQLVTVKAIQDFPYDGRDITAGSVIQMQAIDATIYRRRQLVSATREHGVHHDPPTPPEPEPTPEPVKKTRRRRTYKRRDLVAEEA